MILVYYTWGLIFEVLAAFVHVYLKLRIRILSGKSTTVITVNCTCALYTKGAGLSKGSLVEIWEQLNTTDSKGAIKNTRRTSQISAVKLVCGMLLSPVRMMAGFKIK